VIYPPNDSIDFKAEWDKAFADVNAERAQYLAAVRLQPALSDLAQKQQDRLILRGKLLVWKPMIEAALAQWQQHFETRQQHLQHQLAQFGSEMQRLRETDMQLAREQSRHEQEQSSLRAASARLADLNQRFTLIPDRAMLESRRMELESQRDALTVRIGQVASREPRMIARELQRLELELTQLAQEMRTQGNNLYQQLARQLSPAQLEALNKVLSKPVLTLGADAFTLDLPRLIAALDQTSPEMLNLSGLSLRLDTLPGQYQQRTLAELVELEQELHQQTHELQQQLLTAQALESVKQQRQALNQQLVELSVELRDFDEMLHLQEGDPDRQNRLEALVHLLSHLELQLSQSAQRHEALSNQQQQLRHDLDQLQLRHRQIEQRRNQRQDHEGQFSWLAELPHQPWLGQPEFVLDDLADHLQTYLADCRRLGDLDERIRQLLSQVHSGGLTKYEFVGDSEDEILRLVEFSQHLPQEAEALEKKARSAVVNVSACLRELRDGLLSFKRRMREFNRKISGRQLSDLAVFKIEPEDEAALVEAIELLISTAATVDTGETFELFNHQSVLDDDQLNRAKTLLIEEGNARHGLRVADLFRLRFWVGKADREAEAFDDLDSAASNGTVLMAKLVTGLAMLHLMQDQRRPIQGICYLDEALALDARNQRSLIETAAEFGFSLIFASPAPLTTVRYCVPIHHLQGQNQISKHSWQIFEPLESR